MRSTLLWLTVRRRLGLQHGRCYLFSHLFSQRYYSKIPFNPKAWQLRWCTVDKDGFRSARARGLKKGTKAMNIYEASSVEIVDRERFILGLNAPNGMTILQAPSEDILVGIHRVLQKCGPCAPGMNPNLPVAP